jgi:hypothetical protein
MGNGNYPPHWLLIPGPRHDQAERDRIEREQLLVRAGLCPRCGNDLVRPAGFPADVRACLCGFIFNPADRAAA